MLHSVVQQATPEAIQAVFEIPGGKRGRRRQGGLACQKHFQDYTTKTLLRNFLHFR
ncbi:hypothetical protein Enr13x_14120 [Stieleria neptunia]|uniref:Uncharacterized protein n=1 Tax=Stieleria neptunia TaxID=2527979 RepID=A0A518HLB0_9BACT|nr:hypothetical protein [Stieleria neptunia]QDV41569.1 hypothetical protein Enr13x_14120 [Stieleria neptunia]